jgi:phosphate:Na+ symporter
MIVQSSSAAMALTLVMCENGWISFDIAAAIVLGENIGTTITANIAAIVTNTQSKRAARAHFIFNVFGVLWMLIVFPFYLQGIDKIMVNTAAGSPFTNFHAIKWSLTLFHISFNIINTLLLVWFIPQIVKIVKIMVPSKDTDEEYHLEYIGTGLMKTSELSLLEAQKEVAKFGKIVSKMSGYVQNLLEGEQNNKRHKLFDKILKYEQITDRVEVEVVNYLAKISEGRLSKDASNKVRSILSIVSDLERIGDIFYQMSRSIEKMDEDNVLFTEMQLANMKALFIQLDQALSIMHDNLKTPYEKVEYEIAQAKELEINEMRNKLRKEYFQDIEKGDYNLKSGMIYNDIFNSCEKVGDHIINVTEAILEDYNEKVLN